MEILKNNDGSYNYDSSSLETFVNDRDDVTAEEMRLLDKHVETYVSTCGEVMAEASIDDEITDPILTAELGDSHNVTLAYTGDTAAVSIAFDYDDGALTSLYQELFPSKD